MSLRLLASTGLAFAALAAAAACAPPPDDGVDPITTSITGQVLNAETDEEVPNVEIRTEPPSQRVFTDTEGRYVVKDELLNPGTAYKVIANKERFMEAEVQLPELVEGVNNAADIRLIPARPMLRLSTANVQINAGESAGLFRIENVGDTKLPLEWTAVTANAWITEISPDEGAITEMPRSVTVRIDRAMLPEGTGDVTGTIEVSSNGGAETLTVTVAR